MVAEFTGVRDRQRRARRRRQPRPLHRRGAASSRPTSTAAARDWSTSCWPTCRRHNDEEPPRWPTDDSVDRPTPEAGALMPATSTGQLRRPRRDPGDLSTTASCSSCAPAGRPTSSPRSPRSAGARSASSPTSRSPSPARSTSRPRRRRARFVAFCDAFNLPIVTLVDTPGFYPGKDLEWRGMIRHGAQLVFAYGRATVPRICVILRKSYGGAYIVMDSKTMGNDLCLAWPCGRAGGDGRRAGGGDPAAAGDARGAGRVRGRLRRAPAQPLHRRRARAPRRGHRAGRHPRDHRRGARGAARQARALPPRATTTRRSEAWLADWRLASPLGDDPGSRVECRRSRWSDLARRASLRRRGASPLHRSVSPKGTTCPTPSPSSTIAPASR